jgi:hypothetical protein
MNAQLKEFGLQLVPTTVKRVGLHFVSWWLLFQVRSLTCYQCKWKRKFSTRDSLINVLCDKPSYSQITKRFTSS